MTLEEIELRLKSTENALIDLQYRQRDLKDAFDDLRKYVEKLNEITDNHIRNDKSWMFTTFGG